MKSYTNLEQSKKLAEILPLESADMTLPFRHTKDDKYLPGYVGARSYIDVYNDMIVLPGMDKEEVCKLIQPCWSLAALLDVIPYVIHKSDNEFYRLEIDKGYNDYNVWYTNNGLTINGLDVTSDNFVDACVEMIIKLQEQNLL